jgi:hypothetical protein
MKTIHHLVSVAAAPKQVHDALVTIDGLAGWWTTTVDGDGGQGGVIDFAFNDGFGPDMRVTDASDELVAWTCVGGHDAWLDNTFRFELEPDVHGEKTTLRFWQHYSTELPDDAFGTYNYNWGYLPRQPARLLRDGNREAVHPGVRR